MQTRVLVVGLGRNDKRAFAPPLFDALEKAEFLVDEMEGQDVTPQNLPKIKYDAFVIVCPDPPQAAYELARNIRSQRSSMATVPIILISAGGTFKDKVQAIRGGGDGVFNSSEDPALIVNHLKKHLEEQTKTMSSADRSKTINSGSRSVFIPRYCRISTITH